MLYGTETADNFVAISDTAIARAGPICVSAHVPGAALLLCPVVVAMVVVVLAVEGAEAVAAVAVVVVVAVGGGYGDAVDLSDVTHPPTPVENVWVSHRDRPIARADVLLQQEDNLPGEIPRLGRVLARATGRRI